MKAHHKKRHVITVIQVGSVGFLLSAFEDWLNELAPEESFPSVSSSLASQALLELQYPAWCRGEGPPPAWALWQPFLMSLKSHGLVSRLLHPALKASFMLEWVLGRFGHLLLTADHPGTGPKDGSLLSLKGMIPLQTVDSKIQHVRCPPGAKQK